MNRQPQLATLYSDAKFIHMFRDARDVAISNIDLRFTGRCYDGDLSMLSVSHPPLTAHVSSPALLTEADRNFWREITRSVPSLRSAFLSFPFVAAASQIRTVRIACLRRARNTVGFFPFQFRSILHSRMGVAERVGGDLSDSFGLIALDDVELAPPMLLRLSNLNAIYFTHLDETQKRFGLRAPVEEPGLLIDLADGPDTFWDDLRRRNPKFVSDTIRRERKLYETCGPLKFTFQCSDISSELQRVIATKRKQYELTRVNDPLRARGARALLHYLALLREPDCCAVLSTLYAGRHWVASHFGLLCHGTLHYWFPVYNPELQNFAPGRLLLKAIIDSSGETGILLIDRGSGETQAKRDFANGKRQLGRGVWQRPNLHGFVYRAALAAKWRFDKLTRENDARESGQSGPRCTDA